MVVRHFCIAAVFVVLWTQSLLSFQDASQPEATPNSNDLALMQALRTQIEAIPEKERRAKGVQILKDNVNRFEEEATRLRVYLSIGEISGQLGDTEQAEAFFKKAGDGDGDGVGAISRDHLLDSFEARGDWIGLSAKALEYRQSLPVTDEEFAGLTQRAAMALIRSGDRDGAVEMGIEASINRPCDATYSTLETLSVRSDSPTGHRSYIKGMRWLATEAGEFGRSLRFLENHAHAEEVAGNTEESLSIRERIVAEYPDQELTASALLSVSRLSLLKGDTETARKYMAILASGKYPDEYRSAGQATLRAIERHAAGDHEFERIESHTPKAHIYFIVANVLVAIIVLMFIVAKWMAIKGRDK